MYTTHHYEEDYKEDDDEILLVLSPRSAKCAPFRKIIIIIVIMRIKARIKRANWKTNNITQYILYNIHRLYYTVIINVVFEAYSKYLWQSAKVISVNCLWERKTCAIYIERNAWNSIANILSIAVSPFCTYSLCNTRILF